jgi:hypothetical protein
VLFHCLLDCHVFCRGNVGEILTDKKPSNTRRSRELRFYFTPVIPDGFILLIWALSKGFTGYLKGSAGHQFTKNVLGLIGELMVSYRPKVV